MEEKFIPDYSTYSTSELVDVYSRIDRNNNPLKSKALDEELKKRFNISPDTEINHEIVMSFLTGYSQNKGKEKLARDKDDEMIKQGWIAGVVIASISLLVWTISMMIAKSNLNGVEVTVYGIIDILIIYGLSYGIYSKSRACAIILTGYFILIKLNQLITIPGGQKLFALIGLVVITPFLVRAIIGTINFHRRVVPVISLDDVK